MQIDIEQAVKALRSGEIVAYPTEAVYGLGCDPFNQKSVEQLLHVKQRPLEKGMILVASNIAQISDFVRLEGELWQDRVLKTWPGPYTWVLPLKKSLPVWITGGRETLAVRVSNHPIVETLCNAFEGPIVSTSANPSSLEPARSCEEVFHYFGERFFCIQGELGSLQQPTQIWDAQSNQQLR